MAAIMPISCLDFVRRSFPFDLPQDVEALVAFLCSAGHAREQVAWIIALLVIKQPITKSSPVDDDGKISLPAPPKDFKWDVWLAFAAWAMARQPAIPFNILNAIFEQVCDGSITTLDQAIARVEQLSPNTSVRPRRHPR